ncbi:MULTISPECIES: triphosphoribosyl-dephospho-CoA synthase MdcB [Bradyrhizobium]|uniref:Probable 2-(5''-triphosphoribosyl)-3'-dephosphocoenzyme-A synthase n=1 Tax=Bradyrhizobium diazoefficiens (strain JCM 10833 / BCRC 13528 / IAM 13628 / NBRC 14792 / USDA 110) TaxID=224911 RepID=Q89UY7_BRADU|nr:triphosphoribosyl-dephospho-CoA synthase MdcB [Bradyrhizobium diazoefficiens]MBP1059962.1 triphosphoribosyl-dephospho-CoA synthase [Bradyrhizobium japonicum]AND86947.1 triphosphoribosyl-dephospho-CoA synthase [Bradyrhizobium diazoefficiens USDA 110]AWO88426.1 triphosphoribosyl-dephospho-CoA synthase MdcB [Bradyrhizobium diazoefficiens]PDT59420.1 triphosphoribosyl-dephospho-CoA synthase MdcB [Bradyrhizobium diazoefficiens]QBP20209.1 triphosphoribosyl-dephospho-CoA synthase MdcB [Bradyrhizobi
MTVALRWQSTPANAPDAAQLGDLASLCLKLEVETHPKPGLVSHVDNGAHSDMDAELLCRSADTLRPFLRDLALAGAEGAGMSRLRAIGVAAERAMLAETGGVNTHRGAIFGLGLLCAAAGYRGALGIRKSLGDLVSQRWGEDILSGPISLRSHGAMASRRYGAGGARAEAACGFPSVYEIALPALHAARELARCDEEAVRVQTCMTLIADVTDTNLLHRGGAEGLRYAQDSASAFLAAGGVGRHGWRERAIEIHQAFVARNLSPGGSADLLAMALFVDRLDP